MGAGNAVEFKYSVETGRPIRPLYVRGLSGHGYCEADCRCSPMRRLPNSPLLPTCGLGHRPGMPSSCIVPEAHELGAAAPWSRAAADTKVIASNSPVEPNFCTENFARKRKRSESCLTTSPFLFTYSSASSEAICAQSPRARTRLLSLSSENIEWSLVIAPSPRSS